MWCRAATTRRTWLRVNEYTPITPITLITLVAKITPKSDQSDRRGPKSDRRVIGVTRGDLYKSKKNLAHTRTQE